MNYITFFKGNKNSNTNYEFLSNFYHEEFQAPDFNSKMRTFYFGEQYFMYLKSLEFKDFETAKYIIEHPELKPQDFKRLGRQLKHYDVYGENWEKTKVQTMVKVQFYKYKQKELRQKLLSTGESKLIEASPYDKFWGAGIGSDDINESNYNNLLGKNMLGNILTALRNKMLQGK